MILFSVQSVSSLMSCKLGFLSKPKKDIANADKFLYAA